MNIFKGNKTLSAITTAIAATSNMVETTATKLDSIVEHSLGILEDVAENAHDYTTMTKRDDMIRRRTELLAKYQDAETPQALLDWAATGPQPATA